MSYPRPASPLLCIGPCNDIGDKTPAADRVRFLHRDVYGNETFINVSLDDALQIKTHIDQAIVEIAHAAIKRADDMRAELNELRREKQARRIKRSGGMK